MSIALFFITHEGIASNLLSVAEAIVQKPNENLSYLEIPMDAEVDSMCEQITNKLADLSTKDGAIFITDVFGSTPSNIAQRLASENNAPLISGVNLSMVIRLLNYRKEPVDSLVEKALDGAHNGIEKH